MFEAAGAGHYYLPVGSPLCNAGTPNISHQLKQDFRQMTTAAPGLLQGTVSTPLTLVPEIWRDVDIPDLGWHYPAVDRLAGGVVLTAALTLKDGVAVGLTGT